MVNADARIPIVATSSSAVASMVAKVMIAYGVGVSTVSTVEVKRDDGDYFEEA